MIAGAVEESVGDSSEVGTPISVVISSVDGPVLMLLEVSVGIVDDPRSPFVEKIGVFVSRSSEVLVGICDESSSVDETTVEVSAMGIPVDELQSKVFESVVSNVDKSMLSVLPVVSDTEESVVDSVGGLVDSFSVFCVVSTVELSPICGSDVVLANPRSCGVVASVDNGSVVGSLAGNNFQYL